jgi:hypothetical protein
MPEEPIEKTPNISFLKKNTQFLKIKLQHFKIVNTNEN